MAGEEERGRMSTQLGYCIGLFEHDASIERRWINTLKQLWFPYQLIYLHTIEGGHSDVKEYAVEYRQWQ